MQEVEFDSQNSNCAYLSKHHQPTMHDVLFWVAVTYLCTTFGAKQAKMTAAVVYKSKIDARLGI